MILDGVLDMIRAFHFGHIKAEQAWHDAAEKSACNAGVEKWSTILDQWSLSSNRVGQLMITQLRPLSRR
jgi:hypothetical protein